ncbi:MAG TPA: ABC transporter ATP-binding protein [Symbiobacteriaceae bacterium]|nr:ABC transporter ATP-binding protein [Symbiobacteriaceae bacterium]
MMRTLGRTLREFFRAAPAVACAVLITAVLAGLEPFFSLRILARLIDSLRYLPDGNWRPVVTAVVQLSLVRLAGMTALYASTYLINRLRMTVGITINEQLMGRAAAAPLLDLETPAFHDRMQRAMAARLSMFTAVPMVATMARSLVAVLSILGVLAAQHPGAVLLILAGSAPAWLIQNRSAIAYNAMRKRQAPWRRRVSYLVSLLTGRPFAQEVRLFGLGGYVDNLYTAQITEITTDQIQVATKQSYLQVLARTSGNLAYVGSLALLGSRAVAGLLSAGQFGVMIGALQQLQGTAATVMEILGNLQQNMPAVTDIYAFLDEVPAGQSGQAVPAAAAAPVPVAFEGVSFQSPGARGETLQGISFAVEPGEVVAIVGENGAGKSTLVKLLLGLYQPASGQVVVDGRLVGAPEGGAIRPRIAAVFQEYLRYALKAGENIGVGEVANMGDAPRIARAAAASGAAAVMEALPAGYETNLRREFFGGQELSGGQWQKMAIARAYMREASVLVLDEPTAALDPEAELEVFRQFRELTLGKTAFFISHRLGAARLADRILVLKHGRLVEVGHHDELMARDGECAALFRAQAHWYRPPA